MAENYSERYQPSPEEIEEMAQFRMDADYFKTHFDEFLEQYPGQFVAIYQGQSFIDPNRDILREKLTEAGINPSKAFIEQAIRIDGIIAI